MFSYAQASILLYLLLLMYDTLHIAHDPNPHGAESAIVFLHGIASNSTTWERTIEILGEQHTRIVAIDLLGFGASPKPRHSTYDVSDHALWVERTIHKLKIVGPITFVGHSMGSLIATHLAAKNPGLVDRLILVSPPVLLPPESTPEGQSIRTSDLFTKAYSYLKTHREFTLENSEKVRKIIKIPEAFDITEQSWVPFIKSLERTIETQQLIGDILTYGKKIDVFYGNLDGLIVLDNVRSLRILPSVRVTKVPLSSHAVRGNLATALAADLESGMISG